MRPAVPLDRPSGHDDAHQSRSEKLIFDVTLQEKLYLLHGPPRTPLCFSKIVQSVAHGENHGVVKLGLRPCDSGRDNVTTRHGKFLRRLLGR